MSGAWAGDICEAGGRRGLGGATPSSASSSSSSSSTSSQSSSSAPSRSSSTTSWGSVPGKVGACLLGGPADGPPQRRSVCASKNFAKNFAICKRITFRTFLRKTNGATFVGCRTNQQSRVCVRLFCCFFVLHSCVWVSTGACLWNCIVRLTLPPQKGKWVGDSGQNEPFDSVHRLSRLETGDKGQLYK